MDAERRDAGRIEIPGEREKVRTRDEDGEEERERMGQREREREDGWTDAAALMEGGPRFKGDNESSDSATSVRQSEPRRENAKREGTKGLIRTAAEE